MRPPKLLMATATADAVATTRHAVAAMRVGLMRSRMLDLLPVLRRASAAGAVHQPRATCGGRVSGPWSNARNAHWGSRAAAWTVRLAGSCRFDSRRRGAPSLPFPHLTAWDKGRYAPRYVARRSTAAEGRRRPSL